MTVLDEIAQEKQQVSQGLMGLDAEWAKLSGELRELDIAERALKRFGRRAGVAGKQTKERPTSPAAAANEKRGVRGPQTDGLSLSDASLKAVRAHRKGASANDVLDYVTDKLRMTVRPNHLGMALHRHRRAGRLEYRDQRWYFLTPAESSAPPTASPSRTSRRSSAG
jgi:hypothetical protein